MSNLLRVIVCQQMRLNSQIKVQRFYCSTKLTNSDDSTTTPIDKNKAEKPMSSRMIEFQKKIESNNSY